MTKESTHRAQELKELGWPNDDVVRYSELWDYRQRWGAINLEREDRQFLRKAESALPKIVSGKASVKKPLSEKSYFRWLVFYLEAMNNFESTNKIPQGSRGTWPILLEEELRLIDYYQPVLGLPDTLKAKAFDLYREEANKPYLSLSDQIDNLLTFDFKGPLDALKLKESTKWRQLAESSPLLNNNYPILKSDAVNTFRKTVRNQLLELIPATFPSLLDSEKPTPPDDWSRNEQS